MQYRKKDRKQWHECGVCRLQMKFTAILKIGQHGHKIKFWGSTHESTTRCFSKCAPVRRAIRAVRGTSTMVLNFTELLNKDYGVFFFLYVRQAPVRRSASFASYAETRGGLTVDYGATITFRKCNTHYSFGPALIGQAGKNTPCIISLKHWGRVNQICVFTLQLCKTDDANLRF